MIRLGRIWIVVVLIALPAAAFCFTLTLPDSARQTSERFSAFDEYALPTGPHLDGTIPADRTEGRVERRTWRIDGAAATTLQLLAPLREQLSDAEFEIVFECVGGACGGFDFRFGIEVVPAPDMHVDLQDFRFLAARRVGELASLIVSKSRGAAYIQFISAMPASLPSPVPATGTPAKTETKPQTAAPVASTSLADSLVTNGHVILADLAFAPGGSSLEERIYPSLKDLAAFMAENAKFTVVLVGHTDTVGALASNILLSKRRAEAVRTRLIGTYDVDPKRVLAEGNGYLSPLTSNLSPEGRDANRRVEAILLPQ